MREILEIRQRVSARLASWAFFGFFALCLCDALYHYAVSGRINTFFGALLLLVLNWVLLSGILRSPLSVELDAETITAVYLLHRRKRMPIAEIENITCTAFPVRVRLESRMDTIQLTANCRGFEAACLYLAERLPKHSDSLRHMAHYRLPPECGGPQVFFWPIRAWWIRGLVALFSLILTAYAWYTFLPCIVGKSDWMVDIWLCILFGVVLGFICVLSRPTLTMDYAAAQSANLSAFGDGERKHRTVNLRWDLSLAEAAWCSALSVGALAFATSALRNGYPVGIVCFVAIGWVTLTYQSVLLLLRSIRLPRRIVFDEDGVDVYCWWGTRRLTRPAAPSAILARIEPCMPNVYLHGEQWFLTVAAPEGELRVPEDSLEFSPLLLEGSIRALWFPSQDGCVGSDG